MNKKVRKTVQLMDIIQSASSISDQAKADADRIRSSSTYGHLQQVNPQGCARFEKATQTGMYAQPPKTVYSSHPAPSYG